MRLRAYQCTKCGAMSSPEIIDPDIEEIAKLKEAVEEAKEIIEMACDDPDIAPFAGEWINNYGGNEE